MHLVGARDGVLGHAWSDSSRSASAAGVEQLAQLFLAEQLAEQVAVQSERLRTAFGQWRIALVHVGGDIVDQSERER